MLACLSSLNFSFPRKRSGVKLNGSTQFDARWFADHWYTATTAYSTND